jgi:hypothetical protein
MALPNSIRDWAGALDREVKVSHRISPRVKADEQYRMLDATLWIPDPSRDIIIIESRMTMILARSTYHPSPPHCLTRELLFNKLIANPNLNSYSAPIWAYSHPTLLELHLLKPVADWRHVDDLHSHLGHKLRGW